MTQYIHHVPGRLRLQTERFQDRGAAASACKAIRRIRGVTEARANPIIGSVTITYDRQSLSPSRLWKALCRRGFTSGPLPFQNGVPVARAELGATDSEPPIKPPFDLIINAVLGKLVERCGLALVAALL